MDMNVDKDFSMWAGGEEEDKMEAISPEPMIFFSPVIEKEGMGEPYIKNKNCSDNQYDLSSSNKKTLKVETSRLGGFGDSMDTFTESSRWGLGGNGGNSIYSQNKLCL